MTTFLLFLQAIATVAATIVGLIIAAILVLMAAEWFVRQRPDEWTELDDWQVKVEAMRRMHEQEGDA